MSEVSTLLDEVGYWGEHPEYPVSDWQAEVAANDTRCGYWQWVEDRIRSAAEWAE